MNQEFEIKLILKTECTEKVDTKFVREWLVERFDGCDVGEIVINGVWEKAPITITDAATGENLMKRMRPALEVAREIQDDCRTDASNLDGKPFTGRTMAEAFGETLALIMATAELVEHSLLRIDALEATAQGAKDLAEYGANYPDPQF